MRYEPERAQRFYDDYAEREWTRFHDGRSSPFSLAIHTHYLRRLVHAGDRVLDVGAGPGRFTIELARLGAEVVVADISAVQLELNRQRLTEAGLEARVSARVQADIVDLSALADASFDATVCYGGPLSYALDRADDALAELLRVTRPGGHLLLSVMSLVGSTAGALRIVAQQAQTFGVEAIRAVLRTGDLPRELSGGHLEMHLFRWRELQAMLRRHSCTIVAASASNLGTGRVDAELVPGLSEDERAEVASWEVELAAEPGAIDSGDHILAVVRKERPSA